MTALQDCVEEELQEHLFVAQRIPSAFGRIIERRRLISLTVIVLVLSSTLGALALRPRAEPNSDNKTGDKRSFPSSQDILEMARLSKLVYKFKTYTDCDAVSPTTGNPILPRDLTCHLYLHELGQGTQVLVLSNPRKKYIAIVFAGTDDLRTTLADGDILLTSFPPLPETSVHAGFENAVFQKDLDQTLLQLVKDHMKPGFRIFCTGHSLGAADSVLLAATMVLREPSWKVTSINFGCPKIGNQAFVDALHDLEDRLKIWRFVLGWDLVPRLPEYPFHHVGHTIQMSGNESAKIYYHHVGNATLKYAGVPLGWNSESFLWVPGALSSHRMFKYLDQLLNDTETLKKLNHFERIDGGLPTPVDDDDFYAPPENFQEIQESRHLKRDGRR
jgi:hypothetical protein